MGFFREKPDAQPYPDVPPSLHHDSFEMQNFKLGNQAGAAGPPPPQYDSAGSITPYLGLRARLSQIWFNRWTILLLLVLIRVLILISGLHGNIDDAQAQALAACTKVEDVGSAMASMPHYLSVGVNDLAATGISQTVQGLVALLGMILTGVEQLIIFVINFYIGTYVCLSSALIHGGLDVGIGAANEATDLMNTAIGKITTTLKSDVSGVQDAINAAFSTIASASSIFGKTITPPTLDLSGPIDDLSNIHIDDTSFVQTLQSLNATIPTYDEAENFTKNAISIPFNALKTVLNNTYGAYTFDTSVFPVAKKTPLTFCSGNDNITQFFTVLYDIADHAKTAFLVVLVLLAVLACVPTAFIEIRRWRSQQRRAKVLAQHGFDPLDVVYIASRPYTAGFGIRVASRFFQVGKRQLLARWAIAYATSFPALFVLSLAAAGFFSVVCQSILLAAVQKEAPALTSEVSGFADDVVSTLENVSTAWAHDANGVLLNFQSEINNDILGYVVNATTAVNHTLNVFTAEISSGINAVFNGTVLDNTVQQIVRCLIGIKIDAIEEGLTWVHDHAHVTLPLFPNDTFSVGAKASITNDSSLTSFLADPGSVTSDDITAAVDKVVTALRNSVVQEALISTGLLLVYVVVVLVGMLHAMTGMVRPDKTRGDGGQRFYPTPGDLDGEPTSNSVAPANTAAPFFPRFDGGAETAAVDDATAAHLRDEKLSARRNIPGSSGSGSGSGSISTSSVGGGRRVVYEKKGHWRGSSYGDVGDAGGR
ncbi:pheromone-regulated multispanning membrane protein Prm1 [Sporothrix brasiliensis 5110]|uniref:Plasma membrane fusion protein PRM1 n=1 Tax=Sporothrix brasiliensis 5110 TaxID=1398154 RepID=A0A0C2IYE0_9PEZI|nr:pheromone-regulated multispanning membrane protein Prm1 [Sporothrix brasiliensis 5110]KIH90022.1 pheromone-regulated multispanning membrane protein Prm1 [Sporothrix brasiliensis 5110]